MLRGMLALTVAVFFVTMPFLTSGQLAQAQQPAKGTVVAGILRDKSGTPLGETLVQLREPPPTVMEGDRPVGRSGDLVPLQDRGGLRGGTRVIASTRTDTSGRFVFENVKPGKYRLTANVPGKGSIEEDVEARQGETVTKDLRLK
ncbi:MAG TPA: carboxypeptidase regulatory-like domain-containing protein [Tepidisphaeraceae bacterium]|nr:carboxypeptidase regulatory-like domain-containing protein [Tepidisphaeraceae bacterium]